MRMGLGIGSFGVGVCVSVCVCVCNSIVLARVKAACLYVAHLSMQNNA